MDADHDDFEQCKITFYTWFFSNAGRVNQSQNLILEFGSPRTEKIFGKYFINLDSFDYGLFNFSRNDTSLGIRIYDIKPKCTFKIR